MNELYRLDADELPWLPNPHDCVIKTILVDQDNQCISFVFEDDISGYDSIAYQRPNAKSLVIKYHFYSNVEDYELYKSMKPSLWHRHGGYKCLTEPIKNGKHDALLKLTKNYLEYLHHYVAYKEMSNMSGYIDLYCLNSITALNPWMNSYEISIVCSTKL